MQNYWKKILIGLGLTIFGYIVFRNYRIIAAYKEMVKTLPRHLENNFGEMPEINKEFRVLFIKVSKIGLNIKVSSDIINKEEDIIKVVKSYLINFYPILTKGRIDIKVEERKN